MFKLDFVKPLQYRYTINFTFYFKTYPKFVLASKMPKISSEELSKRKKNIFKGFEIFVITFLNIFLS